MIKDKSLLIRFITWLIIIFGYPMLLQHFFPSNLVYNFFSFNSFLAAIIIVFIVYNKDILIKKFKRYQKEEIFLIIAVVSMLIFAWLKHFLDAESYSLVHLIIVVQAMVVISSAIYLFGLDLFKKTHISLLYSLAAVYLYFIFTKIMWNKWEFFSGKVGYLVYKLLGLFYENVTYVPNTDFSLTLNNFGVIIGEPCSGIESLTLFFVLFCLMVVLDKDKLDFKKAGIVFIVGIIGIYIMNLLRIVLIMIVGLTNPQMALGAFHSQAGWVLFSVFVLGLYALTQRWMIKKPLKRKIVKKRSSKKGKITNKKKISVRKTRVKKKK